MHFQRIKKLNDAANSAMMEGRPYEAYRLKLRAVEEALNTFENNKDQSWLKLAERMHTETIWIRQDIKRKELSEMPPNLRKKVEQDEELDQSFLVTTQTGLDDIGGLGRSKQALLEALEWPLRYRKTMEDHGLKRVMKGCLLFGPPGCGKTMLVEAVAKELKASLLMASPQNLMTKWFGSSEKLISKLFRDAREHVPSVIFIDEVDKILPRSTDSSVIPRVISVFLQEMDGAATHENDKVVVAMGSNEPWKIKEAILRPGRCDRIIYVPPPDGEARRTIFEIHSRSPRLGTDVNIVKLIDLTAPIEGWHYSGSDIMNICNTAKLLAMRQEIQEEKPNPLKMRHFLRALDTVKPQIDPQMLKKYEEWGRKHASFIDI